MKRGRPTKRKINSELSTEIVSFKLGEYEWMTTFPLFNPQISLGDDLNAAMRCSAKELEDETVSCQKLMFNFEAAGPHAIIHNPTLINRSSVKKEYQMILKFSNVTMIDLASR